MRNIWLVVSKAVMSLSGAQVAVFVEEAKKNRSVWAVRDDGGYPAPKNAEGERAMPFWSTKGRAQKIIETVPAYGGLELDEIDLEDWLDKWLPDLQKDGLKVGLNWYGKRATGWHLSGDDVRSKFGRRTSPTALGPGDQEGPTHGFPTFGKFVAWLRR
ncbi:DUF2750 domain-containing protein [Alteriqipengyuania sp. 357]